MTEPPNAHADDVAARRAGIERVDRAIVALLAERVGLVRALWEVKRETGMPFVDPAREEEVLALVARQAAALGLPEERVREIFARIIALPR